MNIPDHRETLYAAATWALILIVCVMIWTQLPEAFTN